MVANTGCVKIGQKVVKALIISVIVVRPASGIVMRFTVGVLTVGIVAVIAIVSLIVSVSAIISAIISTIVSVFGPVIVIT